MKKTAGMVTGAYDIIDAAADPILLLAPESLLPPAHHAVPNVVVTVRRLMKEGSGHRFRPGEGPTHSRLLVGVYDFPVALSAAACVYIFSSSMMLNVR